MLLAHVDSRKSEAGACFTHDWNDFLFHNISASDALSPMPTFPDAWLPTVNVRLPLLCHTAAAGESQSCNGEQNDAVQG